MPHVCARTPDETIIAIVDAVRRGEPRKAVAIDLDAAGIIGKYTAHIPDGTRRDIVRANILERADRGERVTAIASLENCSVVCVVRVLRAHFAEADARARLAATSAPKETNVVARVVPAPVEPAAVASPPRGSLAFGLVHHASEYLPPTRVQRRAKRA